METGPNDPSLRHRWVWAAVPVALTAIKSLLWALATGPRAETWALPGSFALLAALIALSPPTPWWRFHALRMAAYVLCWLPVLLSDLGLYVMVALAPVVLLASVSSTGDLPIPVGGSRLEVLSALMLSASGALWLTFCLAHAASSHGVGTALMLWSGSMGLALVIIGLGGVASLARISRH